jgi:predicted DNA-binding transcriptional regulator AlpA
MTPPGLVGVPQIARFLQKSLSYVYQLSNTDPEFPPVELVKGRRKFFERGAVLYYKKCRKWNRPRASRWRPRKSVAR